MVKADKTLSGCGGAAATISAFCGSCTFLDVGSQNCLGGTANFPGAFIIDDLGPLGTNIKLTYDSDCEYIGPETSVACT